MGLYIIAPYTLLPCELFVDMLNYFREEGACSCGWVEDLDFVDFLFDFFPLDIYLDLGLARVGESLGEVELSLEYIIYRSHHEAYYWLWRVPYAPGFAELGIVLTEECLIKVNNRVFHLGGSAIVL